MNTPIAPDTLALDALLDFYAAAGVDCALEEEPLDRFIETANAAREQQARPLPAREAPRKSVAATRPPAARFERSFTPPEAAPVTASEAGSSVTDHAGAGGGEPTLHHLPDQPIRSYASLHGEEAVASARALAQGADTLEALRQAVAGFTGCGLSTTAKSLVFADGNPDARIMFVGGAPEREEDIEGKPFVGPPGQLLDRMLAAIGLDRATVYLANTVPWRPPGGREPTPQEAEICRPFINRQIELCDPDVLICLGGVPASLLLGTSDGILKQRGKWLEFDTGMRRIKAMATLHPTFLLKNAAQKKHAWRDLLAIRAALEGSAFA